MALAIPGFPAEEFRAGIRTAMRMGLPVNPDHQPEFVFPSEVVSVGGADVDGVPWDVDGVIAPAPERAVRVLCTVETNPTGELAERWGRLQPGTAVVTLLDEEYAQVKGFSYLRLWLAGQDEPSRYGYRRVLEQPNLDAVGVWVLECRTEDEV